MTRRSSIPSHDEHNGVDPEERKLAAKQKRHEKLKRLAETMVRTAFSVEVFALRNGISRRQAFYELASGRVEGRKLGSRTIITDRAERAWQDALPKLTPRDAEALSDQHERPPPQQPPRRPSKLPAHDIPRVAMAKATQEKRRQSLKSK
jgi:hypothetical protein